MRATILVLLASLAACSGKGAGDNAATADTASANARSGATASQSLPAGFRDKFVAQCVTQAQASTPLKVDFTPICGCSADKLLASKSPAELARGVSPADAQAVAASCAKEHPVTLPAKS